MKSHLSIFRVFPDRRNRLATLEGVKSHLDDGTIEFLSTNAQNIDDIRQSDVLVNHLYVDHETGRCRVYNNSRNHEQYDLLTLLGHDRIREAYEMRRVAAPIQLRSTMPYILSGVLFQSVPMTSEEVSIRIIAGTPIVLERRQLVGSLVASLRHVGQINMRCEKGELPNAAWVRVADLIGLRLAADRATDRGLLLSRLDNAILSVLAQHAIAQGDITLSAEEIASAIFRCISEENTKASIVGSLGTLRWREFVKISDTNADRHHITPMGMEALQSEMRKAAALHAGLDRGIVEHAKAA